MERFKEKYRIDSQRMPGWDYSRGGKYYVTICTGNRICCFGNVSDGEIHLSEMGEIADKYCREIPEHFPDTWLDEFVVMPNHIHVIVVMKRSYHNIETKKMERVAQPEQPEQSTPERRDAINRVSTCQPNQSKQKLPGGITGLHNPMLSRDSLGKIIRWYKGRCTYEFNKAGFNWNDWQPRFYDEIIRNHTRLCEIRSYIRNNPANWDTDDKNPKHKKP